MYQPPHHREDRIDVQYSLIESHPLGLLISSDENGITANAIPFLVKKKPESLGLLEAHMARANPQCQEIDGKSVLVVFQGPQNYISPSHYETKRETGKVVPTWNYVMVQVRGIARLHPDAAWMEKQIEALTLKQEATRPSPWAVADAPRTFIESQLRGIVGIEIDITSIEGKWKVSQNRPEADRRGVAEGLSHTNKAMTDIVKEYGNI